MYDQEKINEDNIQGISLIDCFNLKAEVVNRCCKKLHPYAFSIISPKETSKLITKDLSKEQIDCLFSSKERVEALNDVQIGECINKVDPKLLAYLSEKQILANLSKINSKEMFDVIFNYGEDERVKYVQHFSLQTIYQLYEFFKESHWKALKLDKLIDNEGNLTLDFTRIKPEIKAHKELFRTLFNTQDQERLQLVKRFSLDTVYKTYQFFYDTHWKAIKLEKLVDNEGNFTLDFTRIKPETKAHKELFRTLFNTQDQERLQLVKRFSLDTIYKFYTFFEYQHWKNVDKDKLFKEGKLLLDFNKIDESIIKHKPLFDLIFKPEDVDSFSFETIYKTYQFFYDTHWKAIKLEKLVDNEGNFTLDFTRIKPEIKRHKNLFINLFSTQNPERMKLLRRFSLETVYKLYTFFEYQHWKNVDKDKLFKDGKLLLDFNKIDESIIKHKPLFDLIFKAEDVDSFSFETIYKTYQFFYEGHWKALKLEKLIDNDGNFTLDFTRIKPETKAHKELFRNLFSGDQERLQFIKRFSLDSIYKLYTFFDYDHWRNVDKDKLFKDGKLLLDFNKIDESIIKHKPLFDLIFKPEDVDSFSFETIYKTYQFFYERHWKAIKLEKLIDNEGNFTLDFTRIKPETKAHKELFRNLFSGDQERLQFIKRFSLDSIYKLYTFFDNNHWEALGEEQKRNLDVSKISNEIWKAKITKLQSNK